jgi:hypothetical protein
MAEQILKLFRGRSPASGIALQKPKQQQKKMIE